MGIELGLNRAPRDLWKSIGRGIMCRCPNCGEGKLFRAYLKVNDECPVCGEVLSHHRADDLPPYISILIVGHRFPERLRYLEIHGIYNVGLLSFRNDAVARECLHWWRDRCLEWCGIQPEDGKFADQKYLDDWPERFPQTHVLQHKGAGLAPWNGMRYDIRAANGSILVDGEPLIFYHYHGLKFFHRRFYDPILLGRGYGEMPHAALRLLYTPYVQALREAARRLQTVAPGIKIELTSIGDYGWRPFLGKLRRGSLMLDLTRP